MRTIIFLMLIFCLTACSEQRTTNTDLYIYLDYTEGQDYRQQVKGDIDKYLELMEVDGEDNRNYGRIKIYPIHDISSSQNKTVKLKEGKSKLEGNRYLRIKEIDAFKSKLVDAFENINSEFTGKELNSSHIVRPISKGVKKLNQSDADRKVIIIYSDMLENSELANFHTNKINYELLKANFDKVFSAEDLSDCELYIVHPMDKNNDQKIRNAENFWSKYLIEKGLDSEYFHFDTSIDI